MIQILKSVVILDVYISSATALSIPPSLCLLPQLPFHYPSLCLLLLLPFPFSPFSLCASKVPLSILLPIVYRHNYPLHIPSFSLLLKFPFLFPFPLVTATNTFKWASKNLDKHMVLMSLRAGGGWETINSSYVSPHWPQGGGTLVICRPREGAEWSNH